MAKAASCARSRPHDRWPMPRQPFHSLRRSSSCRSGTSRSSCAANVGNDASEVVSSLLGCSGCFGCFLLAPLHQGRKHFSRRPSPRSRGMIVSLRRVTPKNTSGCFRAGLRIILFSPLLEYPNPRSKGAMISSGTASSAQPEPIKITSLHCFLGENEWPIRRPLDEKSYLLLSCKDLINI